MRTLLVKRAEMSCLGCKRSLVQIQSRRPTQTLVNTNFFFESGSLKSREFSVELCQRYPGNITGGRELFGFEPVRSFDLAAVALNQKFIIPHLIDSSPVGATYGAHKKHQA